jgi:hypothetical protein
MLFDKEIIMKRKNLKSTFAAFATTLLLYIILSLFRVFSFERLFLISIFMEAIYMIIRVLVDKNSPNQRNPSHIYGLLLTVILISLDKILLHIFQ